MKSSDLALIFACVIGVSAGQVLFKFAAISLPKSGQTISVLDFISNVYLTTALLIYVAATILWIWILRTIPLNLAYPFMALTFLLVPILASIFVGEAIKSNIAVGGMFIIVGIYLIVK